MRSLHAAVFLLILAITQTEELPLATLVRFRAGWRGHEQIGRTSTSCAICTSNRHLAQVVFCCRVTPTSSRRVSGKRLFVQVESPSLEVSERYRVYED